MRPRRDRWLVALALLPLAPLLANALVAAFADDGELYSSGDHAVVETETLRAGDGDQQLGTYSRYMWHHPGPALFYAMLPVYKLLGEESTALNASAALLTVAAALIVVLVTLRFAGPAGALLAAALVGLFAVELGPETLRDFWIPHTVILPFAALVVLCAAALAGAVGLIPLLALVASFLAQTDLSVAPASGVTVIAAALLFVGARPWRGRERALAWSLGAAALISAIVWFPPVDEELSNSPGNAAAVRKFFQQPDPGHTLGEAVDSVANMVATLPLGRHDGELGTPAGAVTLLILALTAGLLVAGALIGRRRERRFAAGLCALSLVAIVAETYAITNIRGPIFTYIVDWFGAVGVPAFLGIGLALGPEVARVLPARAPRLAAALLATAVVAVTAVAAVRLGGETSLADDPAYAASAEMRTVLDGIGRFIERERVKRPMLYIPHNTKWPIAAGVLVRRYRDGLPVAADRGYLFMFGDRFAPTEREDASIVFADAAQPRPPLADDARPIARVGSTVVYANVVRPARSS